jgi:hypothetical protein
MRKMHAAWLLHQKSHPQWKDAYFANYTEENWDALAEFIRHQKVDALIVANEEIVHELEKRGLQPGEQLPFACMNVGKAGPSPGSRTSIHWSPNIPSNCCRE